MTPPATHPRLLTLGALELRSADTRLLAGRRKVLGLLAYIARHTGPIRRATVATLFWGERDDARARQSLRNALSEIRGTLGSGLQADERDVGLAPGAVTLDVTEFEAAVRQERWEDAARLWNGDFLPGAEDLGDEEWATWLARERTAVRRLASWMFARLIEEAERVSDLSAAERWATRWCETLPHDEDATASRIEVLLRRGRRAEAAAHYESYLALLRSLERDPGDRFRGLAERLHVPHDASPPIAVAHRGLMSPAFIGRDEAMARLDAAWRAAAAGPGRVAVVEADEGMGKSRLCQEFGRCVRQGSAGALVIESRAYVSEHESAWSALRDVVRQLADAPGLAGAPPESLAALAVLEPELRRRLPGLPEAPAGAALDDALVRVIAELAAEQPVLVMLDDAPRADRETLRAVGRLMHNVPNGVLVLVTGDGEAMARSSLAADLRQGAGRGLRVDLEPLEPHELAMLVSSIAPIAPDALPILVPALVDATAGVPGHAVEAISRLAEGGLLVPDAHGEWRLSRPTIEAGMLTPAGARESTLLRLQRLSANAREVLEAAAVIGPTFRPDMLESVAGLPGKAFQDALGELLLRRMLRGTLRGGDAHEFTSEVTRRSIYELIAPSRRAALHRRAARWLGARAGRGDPRVRHHRTHGGAAARSLRWAIAGLASVAVISMAAWRLTTGAPPAEPVTVVLADLRNATGDSIFDDALTSAARIGLQQSRQVAVYPPQRMREVLARMGRADAGVIDEHLAREIAQREGLAAVIALAVERVPDGFQLTLRVIDSQGGRDLAAAREIVSRDDVLVGLDRLLRRSRRALGETARQLAEDPRPLPRVTTASLEALHAYADGRRSWDRRDFAAAGERWARAVQLDSSFAMAWAALADYAFLQKNDPGLGDQHLTRALARTDRLSDREQIRLRLAAATYRSRPYDAVLAARLLAERYPERDTWLGLGYLLMRQERCADALPAIRSGIASDSSYANGWITLATCHQILDHPDSALAAYARAGQIDSMFLRSGNLNQEWGRVFVRLGRLATADSAFRLMLPLGNPLERARGLRSLGFLRMYEGRYDEAIRDFRAAAALTKAQNAQVSELRNRTLAAEALVTAGRIAEARAELELVDRLLVALRLDASFWLYVGHAWYRAGPPERAASILGRADEQTRSAGLPDASATMLATGLLALAERKPRAALAAIAEDHYEPYAAYRHAIRSDAYLLLGILDSALAAAGDLAAGFHFGYDSQDEWLRGRLRIARIAEQLGDTATARAAYGAYLERWGAGDASLPELSMARDRLQRIETAAKASDAR